MVSYREYCRVVTVVRNHCSWPVIIFDSLHHKCLMELCMLSFIGLGKYGAIEHDMGYQGYSVACRVYGIWTTRCVVV
jgi:hypothetical protein